MINGSADKKLSFVFLLLLTTAALYLSFLIARPFLTPIITATLLAVAVYPLFTHILRSVEPEWCSFARHHDRVAGSSAADGVDCE